MMLIPSEIIDKDEYINACHEEIKALTADRDRYKLALKKIVNGTEDEFPPYRCISFSIAQDIAREALAPVKDEGKV